jgi:deoxyribonuclease-4
MQIFTRNQRQWNAKPLTIAEIQAFQSAFQNCRLQLSVCHASYLINLASPDSKGNRRSRLAFRDEVDRCDQLRISYLVFHPGSHLQLGEKAGLSRIASSLNWVLGQRKQSSTILLVETTAGQGTTLGYRFDQLAEILKMIQVPGRVGICLDTCHLFAAGYDLRTHHAFTMTMKQLDAIVGLSYVKAIHLNDSVRELGSRVDRYENIGKGQLGLDTFRFFLNAEQFRNVPMLLETPGGEEGYRRDLAILRTLH